MRVKTGMLKRGQISIEFFLVLSLFALLLYWFNYSSVVAKDSFGGSSFLVQQKFLAKDLAASANAACAWQEKTTVFLPCLKAGNAEKPFEVNASGNRLMVYSLGSPQKTVSVETVCSLNQTLLRLCGQGLCVDGSSGLVTFSEGECNG